MEKDLTTGSILKNIIYFSLPYLLSYFLQTLYGMADLFIIGQFCDVESTTAVSIGSQVMHMITVIVVGLAMGSTVLIGRSVGAKNRASINETVGNTVTLFISLAVILTILLLAPIKQLVNIISTPKEAVNKTVSYLTICFLGIPAITAYNIISSIFRGMGDSKSPMYFVAIACVFNIALDYIFIGALGLNAMGAALGTTLSQALSVIIAFIAIKKKNMIPGLKKKDFIIKKTVLLQILKVGLPVAFQDGFIQISFIIITVFANLRGLSDAAAVGIVEKLIGILFLVPSSLLSTVSALAAQNIGAAKHDRAEKTLLYATLIAVSFGIIAATLFQFIAKYAVALFTKDSEVIKLGEQYMRSYVWDCIFAGIHFSFSGYFCAYNLAHISFIHNFASIVLARVPIAYFASKKYPNSLFPMGLAAPIGSVLSVIICVFALLYLKSHKINDTKL